MLTNTSNIAMLSNTGVHQKSTNRIPPKPCGSICVAVIIAAAIPNTSTSPSSHPPLKHTPHLSEPQRRTKKEVPPWSATLYLPHAFFVFLLATHMQTIPRRRNACVRNRIPYLCQFSPGYAAAQHAVYLSAERDNWLLVPSTDDEFSSRRSRLLFFDMRLTNWNLPLISTFSRSLFCLCHCDHIPKKVAHRTRDTGEMFHTRTLTFAHAEH